MERNFDMEEVCVPGLQIWTDEDEDFDPLPRKQLINVAESTEGYTADRRLLNLKPGELTARLNTPLCTGSRDEDELEKERLAMREFLFTLGFLPVLEWGGLLLFWKLGCWKWSITAYSTMLAMLVLITCIKFRTLRHLQQGSFQLHEVIERVLNGKVGGFVASMMSKVFGKSTPFPLVLYSMPAFLEGATTVFAMPVTFHTFEDFPEINERWLASWGGLMPFSLPTILLGLVIITVVMHAIFFYAFLYKACQQLEDLGRAEYEVVKTTGFKQLPGLLKARLADVFSRSLVWHSVGNACSQANLGVLATVSDTFVKNAFEEKLSGIAGSGRRLFRVDYLPDGGKRPPLEQELNSRVLGSPSRIVFRVCLNTAVQLWIKISLLADGFKELGVEGRAHLLVAILMGLLTMALTLPDQIDGFRGDAAAFYTRRLPAFILTFTLLMMLAFRLFAVYFFCEKHVFNFSSLSCYDEATSVWQKIAMFALFFCSCCGCNFAAVIRPLGRHLALSLQGI